MWKSSVKDVTKNNEVRESTILECWKISVIGVLSSGSNTYLTDFLLLNKNFMVIMPFQNDVDENMLRQQSLPLLTGLHNICL